MYQFVAVPYVLVRSTILEAVLQQWHRKTLTPFSNSRKLSHLRGLDSVLGTGKYSSIALRAPELSEILWFTARGTSEVLTARGPKLRKFIQVLLLDKGEYEGDK